MKISQRSEQRLAWLDLLRAAAVSLVLLCHATEEGIYLLDLSHVASYSWKARLFAFSSFTAGRLGVPLFLMITGYTLLSRPYDEEQVCRFWKERCFRLLICTQLWFLLYDLFLKFYIRNDIPARIILQDVFFLHKVAMPHVWYMPMILGIYLLVPLAANGLKDLSGKRLCVLALVLFVLLFVYPILCVLFNTLRSENELSPQIQGGFSGGCYGFYLLIGYMIKKGVFQKLTRKQMILAGSFAFSSCVCFQLWAYSRGYAYNTWYYDPMLLISAASLFLLVSRIKHVPFAAQIRTLSDGAFGVYSTHILFKYILIAPICSLSSSRPPKVILLLGAMWCLSYFSVFVMKRIPVIGRFLLYMK